MHRRFWIMLKNNLGRFLHFAGRQALMQQNDSAKKKKNTRKWREIKTKSNGIAKSKKKFITYTRKKDGRDGGIHVNIPALKN